jgi:hypothetical protein
MPSLPRSLSVLLVLALTLPALRSADDAAKWIDDLASPDRAVRQHALDGLNGLGDAGTAALIKAEAEVKMEPRQLFLVRHLIGDRLIQTTPLKLVDLSTVTPFGEDQAKGIKGDENIATNPKTKLIVMNGEFVLEQGPLEYLICVRHRDAKLHETIVGVLARPRDICYALLASNYKYVDEVDPDGSIKLPPEAGIMISLEYEWAQVNADMGAPDASPAPAVAVPAEKKWVRVPIEFFAFNTQTEKPMRRSPFAFTGSKFEKDENGKMTFMADLEKSVVALKYDVYAIMNTLLDTKDIDPQHAAGYSINRYAIPPRGTKCRIVFEPWSGGQLTKADLKDTVDGKASGGAAPNQPDK